MYLKEKNAIKTELLQTFKTTSLDSTKNESCRSVIWNEWVKTFFKNLQNLPRLEKNWGEPARHLSTEGPHLTHILELRKKVLYEIRVSSVLVSVLRTSIYVLSKSKSRNYVTWIKVVLEGWAVIVTAQPSRTTLTWIANLTINQCTNAKIPHLHIHKPKTLVVETVCVSDFRVSEGPSVLAISNKLLDQSVPMVTVKVNCFLTDTTALGLCTD